MRNKTINNAYTRAIVDKVDAVLTLTTTAISTNQYLHSNVIRFPIFPEQSDTYIQLIGYEVRETDSAGSPSLKKAPFNLYLFDYSDQTFNAGDAFALTSNTTINNIQCSPIVIVNTDYQDIDTKSAGIWKPLASQPILKGAGNTNNLVGVAVAKGSVTYAATSSLKITLIAQLL